MAITSSLSHEKEGLLEPKPSGPMSQHPLAALMELGEILDIPTHNRRMRVPHGVDICKMFLELRKMGVRGQGCDHAMLGRLQCWLEGRVLDWRVWLWLFCRSRMGKDCPRI